MSSNTIVQCDQCNATLSPDHSPAPITYLELRAVEASCTSAIRFDVNVLPPIPNTLHFCGLGCLQKYVADYWVGAS